MVRLGRVGQFMAMSLAAAGIASGSVVPATAAPPAAASAQAKERDFVKVSDDAYKALRDVRATRLAIFEGLPDDAKRLVLQAKTDIRAAVKDADKYAIESKTPVHEGDMYVPFDADLTLADSFVATPEKAEHIRKANEHLKKGAKKEAVEVLRLADIDVVFTAASLPVKLAQSHIDDAAKLIDQGKYYEANLALKAVEDSTVIDSYGVDEVPVPKMAKAAKAQKGKK